VLNRSKAPTIKDVAPARATVQRQGQHHHTQEPRHPSAGLRDFRQQQLDAQNQQEEDHIGVRQDEQRFFQKGGVQGDGLGLRGVQHPRSFHGLDGDTVQLQQQVVQVLGHQVDEPDVQRLLGGKGIGFGDEALGHIHGLLAPMAGQGTGHGLKQVGGLRRACSTG